MLQARSGPSSPRLPAALRAVARRAGLTDQLYRGSALLLANTLALSLSGVGFWTLAAHLSAAAEVGKLAAAIAAATLIATLTSLGLPNLLMQRLASDLAPRRLLGIALTAILLPGGAIGALLVLVAGPALPGALHETVSGYLGALMLVLMLSSSVSNATSSGLVALRRADVLLATNLGGALVRFGLLVPLATLGYRGLMLAYVAGAFAQSLASVLVLRLIAPVDQVRPSRVSLVRRYFHFSAWNYVGTLFGTLPSSFLPMFVVGDLGARRGGYLAGALLVAGTVNLIPSNTAQALYAELRQPGARWGALLRRAMKAIYGLSVPYILLLAAGAPLILRLLGHHYATGAGPTLRAFALGGLFTGGTYVVDILLIAAGRVRSYTVMNALNALLVVAGTVVGARWGLLGVGAGWSVAQALSLLIGVPLSKSTLSQGRGIVLVPPTARTSRGIALSPPRTASDKDAPSRANATAQSAILP